MNMIRTGAAIFCATLAVGCSDDPQRILPPPPDLQAPDLSVQFPSADSYTDLATITVRGMASDVSSVANVRVNGNAATTTDNFATWEASVTLASGVNTITIDATDSLGNFSVREIDVVRERGRIVRPFGSELDTASDTLYFVDIDTYKIMTITLADGEVAEFADLSQFIPANPGDTPPLDLALDLANDSIYLTVASNSASGISTVGIWRYDTAAETWSAFSDSSIDPNAVLQVPSDVILDSANNRLLVIDFIADSVVAVSLADGSQSELGANQVIPLSEATDAVIDAQANRLIVINRGTDTVVGIDLATGARSLISDNVIDPSPNLRQPLSITLDSTGNRALIQDSVSPGLIAVDLATGLRDGVSANGQDPVRLADARSLALRGNEILALDNQSDHLIAIDLTTEARRIITNNGFPRGSASRTLESVFATDSGAFGDTQNAVVLAGGASGFEVIAGDPDGSGLSLDVKSFAVDATSMTGYALEDSTTSTSEDRISTVDLVSGSTQIISDGGLPDDVNPLDDARDIAFDAANNRVVVLTRREVLAVSLSNGSRTVLSPDAMVPFMSPRSIYVDSPNNRLLVVDGDYPELIAIDASGNRSLFATMAAPGDSSPEYPEFLAADADGGLWLYDESDRFMAIDPVTGARTPIIDVSDRDRPRWRDVSILDDVLYAVVDDGVLQLDLRTEDSVIIYGSAPVSSGVE